MSVTIITIIIISLCILSIMQLHSNYVQTHNYLPKEPISPFNGSFLDVMINSGLICFAYTSILCLVPVYNELKEKNLTNG